MMLSSAALAAEAILVAALIDRCIGDPLGWPHPVMVMGWWISQMRQRAEAWAGDNPKQLKLSGLVITVSMVGVSGLSGWLLEQLSLGRWLGHLDWVAISAMTLTVIGLASALAGRSLEQAVLAVLTALEHDDLAKARTRLQWIVGRDTSKLEANEMLRAAAETAAENAVDGLFAPLFWMVMGLMVWLINDAWPGPLALAWAFKAASTLDSMLGYRRERLRWLGSAGARLDDLMVWVPCRLVMLSLPLTTRPWRQWWDLVTAAERDGKPDPSPNAGRAEAIYAHCAGLCLGGRNRYQDHWVNKPLLAEGFPDADAAGVRRILNFSLRLEGLWLLVPLGIGLLSAGLWPQ